MTTLPKDQNIEITRGVATANLTPGIWTGEIKPETITDALGREALEITIILTPGSSTAVTGDVAINTVFDLNQRLQDAGEERFSIVRYSSE
jgi:hypothetical protein